MEQKEYWDSVADEKTFTTPFQKNLFVEYVSKNERVLDVGCGYGRTLEELHQLGYEALTGLDFSEGMIRRGKNLYPYLDLRVKASEAVDLPDASVDAVILFAVLTCIIKDGEQRALIDEIKRVLRPGGILYVNDFLLNDDERNLRRYEQFADEYGCYGVFRLPEGAEVRHHSRSWIEDLLSGFEQKEFQPLTFITMNGNKSNGFCYIGKCLK